MSEVHLFELLVEKVLLLWDQLFGSESCRCAIFKCRYHSEVLDLYSALLSERRLNGLDWHRRPCGRKTGEVMRVDG